MNPSDCSIHLLQCTACHAASLAVTLGGDADVSTEGVISAVADGEAAVIVAKARPEEWSASAAGRHDGFEARLTTVLGQPVRVPTPLPIATAYAPTGSTFQQFRAAHRPPECLYACRRCGGACRVVETVDMTEFQARGGQVHGYLDA